MSNILTRVRHIIFPDSKLVDSGTKQINEIVNSIRHETSTMNKNTDELKKPDTLWALHQSMRSIGR